MTDHLCGARGIVRDMYAEVDFDDHQQFFGGVQAVYVRCAMSIFKLSMVLLLLMSPFTAYASKCSESQYRQAEEMPLDKWDDVYTYFKKYRQCDDAETSEVTSVQITHMMAVKWKDIKTFERFVKKNKAFKAFVFDHINEMADYDDIERIVMLSRNQCQMVSASLCDEIYQSSIPIKNALTPTQ